VLQNEKYIEFADDNTVEILALGSIDDGINKKDKRADLYDAKDGDGKDVKYMKEFAGCTVDQLQAMNGSPAGQYNKTGHIPYVSIVDPFTLKEIHGQPGGYAAGGLMKAVAEAKDQLNKEHGASVKRSVLKKVQADVKAVEATLASPKGGVAKALADLRKVQAGLAKEADSIKAETKPVEDKILEAAKAQLDDAEAKISSGDVKGAGSILSSIGSGLKGTDLEARVKELNEKLKNAAPAK
jgi:hypothetical protein